MEKDKVQAIMDWPEPQNVKQVQSFLGFANFYHCFVPNFSCLARPLNNLTQKEQPWIWLEEQKAAFDAIKAEICKEPVLAHPDESKPYTLETDASGAAMGAVLSQRKEDGCLHPVAFMSASFSPAELNYDTHDKELLAIICAFEHWRIFWKELSSQSLCLLITRIWSTGNQLEPSTGVMRAGISCWRPTTLSLLIDLGNSHRNLTPCQDNQITWT
ncbi:Encoded by [Rhizoctonia solani]|uniref:Encoded by n=1 Tax=Rhizoctonia solani TaxID=456999 RepID=A0A8H7I376_9AGAM|nr:Encoded by [Rhizoctonia solani]